MTTRVLLILTLSLIVLFFMSGINNIPRLNEQVNADFVEVQNQYERRMDLMPSLIEIIKGSSAYDKTTLSELMTSYIGATRVTISPDTFKDAVAFEQFEHSQAQLTAALSHLLAVSQNDPSLQSNQNFIKLRVQLEGSADRIAVARRDFIKATHAYNAQVRSLPGALWAHIYGARPQPEFIEADGADIPSTVKY